MKRSRIRQMPESGYGPLYFRQALRVSGRIDGHAYRGRVAMDYCLPTARRSASTATGVVCQ
jgi:hypothetical protein